MTLTLPNAHGYLRMTLLYIMIMMSLMNLLPAAFVFISFSVNTSDLLCTLTTVSFCV